ncbi:hypothetical protein NWF24_17710 [Variovorax paradoxus]|uniref:hypothetical protein n=1 Tax=Variovorax paradoxus TaxID=34073 RepID=UPI0021AD4DB3|nr:hypothetical protein [Variovorax paradoxus]UVH54683.1 hypothetical protein NWF24_17710 [Variovorax paradoxus]
MFKCPKCEKVIQKPNVQAVAANIVGGGTLKSIAYTCSSCSTVLSVTPDPYALKDEIVAAIKRG